jgi:hypothetical protein
LYNASSFILCVILKLFDQADELLFCTLQFAVDTCTTDSLTETLLNLCCLFFLLKCSPQLHKIGFSVAVTIYLELHLRMHYSSYL